MYKDIKFTLERYRPGGGNRYTCPFCGQKKCFTRYIYIDTGEYVDKTCGKCNHENSCPVVHYPPRDFFRDHPGLNRIETHERTVLKGTVSVLGCPNMRTDVAPIEYSQTEFFDISWAEQATLRMSTFRTWFESLPFDSARIAEVLAEYYVGATEKDVVVNGINYGPASVFWMIDDELRVHDAKLIAYTSDGHRVEGWGNSMRSICEKSKKGPQLTQTEKVLFGLHLLSRYPDKVVCIVESEKTALVCACHYPQFVWLATGGCGNLQPSKLRSLMNRSVVVYPDSGEYDKWNECMKKSGHNQYFIEDLLEDYESNTDIADIILGDAIKKDECPF